MVFLLFHLFLCQVLQYLFDSIESMKCEEPDSKHKLSLSFIEVSIAGRYDIPYHCRVELEN